MVYNTKEWKRYITINEIILLKRQILTLVVIFGGDSEHRVLNVLIFIYLSLVEALVEVWGIIVLVGYPNANEFCYCNMAKEFIIRPILLNQFVECFYWNNRWSLILQK